MIRRRTDDRLKLTIRDIGIHAFLDLHVGPPMPGTIHRHGTERCTCQNSFASYREFLATYRHVRDEMAERQTGKRPEFAERLYRAARRWPRRDVEALGNELWQRRSGVRTRT